MTFLHRLSLIEWAYRLHSQEEIGERKPRSLLSCGGWLLYFLSPRPWCLWESACLGTWAFGSVVLWPWGVAPPKHLSKDNCLTAQRSADVRFCFADVRPSRKFRSWQEK